MEALGERECFPRQLTEVLEHFLELDKDDSQAGYASATFRNLEPRMTVGEPHPTECRIVRFSRGPEENMYTLRGENSAGCWVEQSLTVGPYSVSSQRSRGNVLQDEEIFSIDEKTELSQAELKVLYERISLLHAERLSDYEAAKPMARLKRLGKKVLNAFASELPAPPVYPL